MVSSLIIHHFHTSAMTRSLAEHDAEILQGLLASRAEIASHLLSEKLGITGKVSERTRKETEEEYLAIKYSTTLEKYGLRQVEFLISTGRGRTLAIGKDLLKRDQVAYVARTIGQFNIDLRAEVFVHNGEELMELIEAVKAMDGVKDMVWSEVIEVVGRKNHIPSRTLETLRKKEAIMAIS
jgi:hypothetical protein